MIKTILKVVYFTFAAILGVIVYSMGYQSSSYGSIESKLNKFIDNKEYSNVARIFGALFDSTNLAASEQTDKMDIAIFAGAVELKVNYYEKNDKDEYTINTHHTYDMAYYVYLFNTELENQNASIDNKLTNYTAITFYNEDGKEYHHYFNQSQDVNSTNWIEKPLSVEDTLVHSTRDSESFYANWGFYNFTFDRNYINTIVSRYLDNKPITHINITDGKVDTKDPVMDSNLAVNLDFSQQFFTDVNPLVEANSTFIPIYDDYNGNNENKLTEEQYNEHYKAYEDATKNFEETFFDKSANYTTTFKKDEIMPATIIWQAIGMVAIYILVVIILYLLLFKLKWIKSLIFRDRKGRNVPNKISPKKEAIDAEYKEINK